MKKLLFPAVAAVVAIVVYVAQPFGSGGAMTPQMAEAELLQSSESAVQTELYETLKSGYPDEYAAFLQDMADFANAADDLNSPDAEQSGFQIGQKFTTDLRRDNARYIATAPLSAFIEMRDANLALLRSMSDDPNMCARMALFGGSALTMADIPRIDMDLMAGTGVVTFKAMIAGRDTPFEHPAVTDADIRDVVDMWQLLADNTPARIAAFFSNNPNNPETCAAHISFEEFLNTSDDPLVQNVAVHLTRLAVGI